MTDVSIIVATYHRPQAVVSLCDSLRAQSLPRARFEVVVVDDGSPQAVGPLLEPFADDLQLRVIRQANSGPAVGRNRAAAEARGEFLLMTDDDCRPAPDWAERLLAALQAEPDAMVGGYTENGLPQNLFATVSQMVVDRVYEVHNRNPRAAGFFTSNNLGVRRELFLQMGGFDAHYRYAGAEDRGLCDRWRNAGLPMHYVPEARVLHFHQMTLRRYLRQHFNYGRGALRYHLTRRTSHGEEASTARDIVFDFAAWRAAIRRHSAVHSVPAMVALLVLWQVANAAGYFWEMLVRATPLAATGRPPHAVTQGERD